MNKTRKKQVIVQYLCKYAKERLETIELVVTIGGDPEVEQSLRIIKKVVVSADGARTPAFLRRQAKKYQAKGRYLFRYIKTGLRIILLIQKRKFIIRTRHGKTGYRGISPTPDFVGRAFWWLSMRKAVTDFVKSFRACQPFAKENNMFYNHYQPFNCIFVTYSWILLNRYRT